MDSTFLTDEEKVRSALSELATQSYNIAMGLQAAAPARPDGGVSGPVQYLLEISLYLNKASQEMRVWLEGGDSGEILPR